MVEERWAAIPGHPGYEVSDQGRVRSYRNRQGHAQAEPRLMTPKLIKGYPRIKLGRSFQSPVHSLVLRAFVGPRPEGFVCRHLDSNPENNLLGNLRWGTLEENYADRYDHGTHNTGSRNGRATINEAQAHEIKVELSGGNKIREVALRFGVSHGVVANISSDRTWMHVKV